ncbi:MAG: response regulator [Anaerolineae bacterium]|nr:response regulator [Anaerolineae bacterium]
MTHILVADPTEAFAILLSDELKRQGYDTTVCNSGANALAAVQQRMPDMAILDLALEEPDTFTLAAQLRELEPALRLMFIPFMGEDLPPAAASIAVQGVLPKPFFLPELPGMIEAALQAPIEGAAVTFLSEAEPVAEPVSVIESELMFVEEIEPVPVVETIVQADSESVLVGEPVVPQAEALAPVVEPEAVLFSPVEAEPVVAIGPEMPEEGLSRDTLRVVRPQVERAMNNLAQEVGADAVLLTLGAALGAWVGQLDATEAEGIGRAVVNGWRTSAEVARILGRKQSRFEQSTDGGDYTLYALSVDTNAIMVVVIRGSATLGLLRHRAREAAEKIARLCA